ncbi:hypothetical protein FDECE_15264 [Fusarium decemcellulare]|nr:hypothetical protein FDECE_15264 [Fusarium decemcellulare]
MASSPTLSIDESPHEPPGSNMAPESKAAEENRPFKLGDFTTRLAPQDLACWAYPKDSGDSDKPTTLGNFKRLFDKLRIQDARGPHQFPSSSPTKAKPITILKRPSEAEINVQPAGITRAPEAEPTLDPFIDSEAASGSDTDLLPVTSYSTAASTPPSSTESHLESFTKPKQGINKTPKAKDKSHRRDGSQSKIVVWGGLKPELTRHILSYQHFRYGPVTEIHGHADSAEAKHEKLMRKLVHQRVVDSMICKESPNIASNGIHVFIDMSNIIIGFQKALRAKYSLSESTRFVPLPQMNLQFFHELLLRDRHAECLNVGCSMHPDRGQPPFIQELQDLGYRVDLRNRRPENANSDDHGFFETGGFRYVEDMVDETLQIRIGESVMQYFDNPGTLVLATGDARPAKYSDGFLAYAQRALKMGWSVEVVSWKSSRSSAWNGPLKDESIGSRFRVIELDQFLDQLWIC